MSSSEFSLAARLRLFLPPSDHLGPRCSCRSYPLLAHDPSHFLSCGLLKDLRRVRHDRIVRHFSSLIQRVGGVCQIEPSHFPIARPDLLVFLFDSSYLLDLVVSHPAAPSYLSKPLPLTCSKYAESRKISHYASSLPPDSSLVPFALETFGAIGFQASRFLQLLISTARDTLSSSLPSPPISASLAILLQKCNAYILSRGVVLSRSRLFLHSASAPSLRGFPAYGFPRSGEVGVPQLVLTDRI